MLSPVMNYLMTWGLLSSLVLIPELKIWLWDMNEICFQGLNLSSTQASAFNHDLEIFCRECRGGLLPSNSGADSSIEDMTLGCECNLFARWKSILRKSALPPLRARADRTLPHSWPPTRQTTALQHVARPTLAVRRDARPPPRAKAERTLQSSALLLKAFA